MKTLSIFLVSAVMIVGLAACSYPGPDEKWTDEQLMQKITDCLNSGSEYKTGHDYRKGC